MQTIVTEVTTRHEVSSIKQVQGQLV